MRCSIDLFLILHNIMLHRQHIRLDHGLREPIQQQPVISRDPVLPRQILPHSAVQFLWHCYPQILYIQRPVGTVVLTDNSSKYKEFIVTYNTKTRYVRPLMMKISSEICHNYHKSKLTMTIVSFVNGKIKKEPRKS